MTTQEIEKFERLLAAYGLSREDYDGFAVANFADDMLDRLDRQGEEGSETYTDMDFLSAHAYGYARVVEAREADAEYDKWLARAASRRRYDPFYQMI